MHKLKGLAAAAATDPVKYHAVTVTSESARQVRIILGFLRERGVGKTANWWLSAVLPLTWFLIAYVGTTVIAALAYAVVPGGQAFTQTIGVIISPAVAADIGTPLYFALLLLPLAVVPLVTLSVIGLGRKFGGAQPKFLTALRSVTIQRPVLLALMVASFAYCAFRLAQVGALNLDVLACGERADKLVTRMALLDNLGFGYFMFAYGVNMMLPLLAYLAYQFQGRAKTDLAIFVVALLGMAFFVLETYSKAPMLVFVVMMASVVIVARAPLRHLLLVAVVCGAVFIAAGALINASQTCGDTTQSAQPQDVVAVGDEGVLVPVAPTVVTASTQSSYVGQLLRFGMVQRMAVGFPYYVHIYNDETQRCGIQGSMLRSILRLPPPKCVMATRVFNEMWPGVTSVQGNQPAPATLSAYGELGFGWAVVVMVLSGAALGLLGLLAAAGPAPIFVAICAAAAGFAYYLTQVPFIASFTYPHGLFAFLIPVVALVAYGLIVKRPSSRTTAA
jgi:hypothetical protein